MATITMTPDLSAALLGRLQAEYGQQALSNFALDILLDSANAEIARLTTAIVQKDEITNALSERVRLANAQLEEFKQAQDPKRAEVMGSADKVRELQAKRRGSNSN